MNSYASTPFHKLLQAIQTNNYAEETGLKDLCNEISQRQLTEREAILLVRVLRKTKNFEQAERFHKTFKITFPSSSGLQSEALWFKFSNDVCYGDLESAQEQAQYIIDNAAQDNSRTKLIYEITVLMLLSRLVREKEYRIAYSWYSKLNPFLLGDTGRTVENGNFYPSNKLRFYRLKAATLIGLNKVEWYIDWVYNKLEFVEQRLDEFVGKIVKNCTYVDYYGNSNFMEGALSNYLYMLDIDMTTGINNLPIRESHSNFINLSELSQYLFCPVSYVINKSFNIPKPKVIDTSTIWKGNKDGFYDRFLKYQKTGNIEQCFEHEGELERNDPFCEDPSIIKDEIIFQRFEEFFNGKFIVNNYFDTTPKTYTSNDGRLKGAPDYILELLSGERVLIMEKFSAASSSGAQKIYNSDIIAMEAYLTKFKALDLNYGCFINWTWSINRQSGDGQQPAINEMYISNVITKKIYLSDARESLVNSTVDKIEYLNKSNVINNPKIGFANKCLNCSVYSYCEHKSGAINNLQLY